MVAKCFYCQTTNVEIAHIKECAVKTAAAKAPALVTASAAPAKVTVQKAIPAYQKAIADLKAKAAPVPVLASVEQTAAQLDKAYAAKVEVGVIVEDKTPAAPAAPEKVAPADMEIGHYFKDGNAYKIVWNKTQTKKYAMKLYIQPFWGKKGKTLKGTWVYDSGAIYNLQPEHKMTKEQADNYAVSTLEKYGVSFCCVCGKKLTAKESVSKGIGPVCAANLGV